MAEFLADNWQFPPQSLADSVSDARIIANDTTSSPPMLRLQSVVRKAQCTHMYVDRVFLKEPCENCGNIPTTGFLYTCRQDDTQEDIETENLPGHMRLSMDLDNLESIIQTAETISMSSSVIQHMKDGFFSEEQVHRLIEQRVEVLNTIYRVKRLVNRHYDALFDENGQYRGVEHDKVKGEVPTHFTPDCPYSDELMRAIATMASRCSMTVCLACRPFMRERFYSSFESVMNQTPEQIEENNLHPLPVLNAEILKRLNQPKNVLASFAPSEMSLLNWSNIDFPDFLSQSEETSSSESSNSVSEYSFDSTRAEVDERDIHRPSQSPSETQTQLAREYSSLCTCIGKNSPTKSSDRSASNNTSPLRSMHRHEIAAASTPLSTHGLNSSTTPPSSSVMTPLTPLHSHAGEECFNDSFSRVEREASLSAMVHENNNQAKRASVSFPSLQTANNDPFQADAEIHVPGGVAVTEEAVEHGIPDVFTS